MKHKTSRVPKESLLNNDETMQAQTKVLENDDISRAGYYYERIMHELS